MTDNIHFKQYTLWATILNLLLLLFVCSACHADDTETLMAKVILGEAVGDGEEGMRLVSSVVINRSKAYHKTIRGAIVQRGAFYGLKSGLYERSSRANRALAHKIAKEALSGKINDKTGGALFFINPKHEKPFKWCKVKTYQYKNHVFYK